MSIFNEEQIKAMFSREYICHECGHLMEFEDEWEDTLVCPHCGHSIDLDDYGREGNEEYENLYPTREEVLGIANDDSEEDFDSRSGECTEGLYPTVTIRQIMWALKMKPIQRQRWETCFDRRKI